MQKTNKQNKTKQCKKQTTIQDKTKTMQKQTNKQTKTMQKTNIQYKTKN